MRAVVVAADMITPYGPGVDACWEGLLAGRTAVAPVTRFETVQFHSGVAGIVPGLAYHGDESLVMQMLRLLFDRNRDSCPSDAQLILATIKGEIDLLEKSILGGSPVAADCGLDRLLEKVAALTGVTGEGLVVSSACTSSAAAAARGAAMIRSGRRDAVLVVACDSVNEFIYSGFSTLMALDPRPARPFDRGRCGLSVGEAAAFVLIMSEKRARREQRPILGELAGWGMSDDANHMTGPSRESEGLVLAIGKALRSAEVTSARIGFISAHGTGTVYNDAMEMQAFRKVFMERSLPVYSLKGGIGHTMGAAGLVEMIIALRALREGIIPPTVNLTMADADAVGWASDSRQAPEPWSVALVTNAGFGGVNTALVLRSRP
jgi:3-oxoacyl-[acyl-carrier-protein] synthase II